MQNDPCPYDWIIIADATLCKQQYFNVLPSENKVA